MTSAAEHLTYCSFADDDDGCRGVLVLPGELSPVDAARVAWALGLNPGGELLAVPVCEDEAPAALWAALRANTGRLIAPAEAARLFDARRLGDFEKEAAR